MAWDTHRKNDSFFIDNEIYQKSSYGSNVPSETPSLLPYPKTSRIYLIPLPP